jgi:hypothetical protein
VRLAPLDDGEPRVFEVAAVVVVHPARAILALTEVGGGVPRGVSEVAHDGRWGTMGPYVSLTECGSPSCIMP